MIAVLSSLLHSTCTSESAAKEAAKPCWPACWLNRRARTTLALGSLWLSCCSGPQRAVELKLLLPAMVLRLLL